jgi:hypothetical protein
MKTKKWIVAILFVAFVTVAAGILQAQSLADIARKERAKKASEPKATKVYTNDNIPPATMTGSTTESAQATAKAPESGEAASGGATSDEGKKEETKPENKKMTKEYWQAEFNKARAEVDLAQEQANLADDELNLAQANQVREADPTKKADYDPQIATDRTAAEAKHAALDKAKQKLDDLKKRFEESGAPADWLPSDDMK